MKILKFFGFDRRNRSPIQENKANPPSKKEEVPISPGRVSEPDDDPGNFIHTLKGLTQMVTPSFRVEVIQLLRDLYKVNPDVNIALQDMFKLANTGHNITFPNNTDKEADKMRDHLSKVSSKWSNYTAGMDGLVNKMIVQLMISGAISVEAVPNEKLEGLATVLFLKPDRIVFKRENNGVYSPYQRNTLWNGSNKQDYIKLNTETYCYVGMYNDTDEPYGVPPFMAALDSLKGQHEMRVNFKNIMEVMGMVGFLEAKMQKPQRLPSESIEKYQDRLIGLLKQLKVNLMNGMKDGIVTGFIEDHEFKLNSTTQNLQNLDKPWTMNQQSVANGLGVSGNLIGVTSNTTEGGAGILLSKIISQLKNLQTLTSFVLEFIYSLELRLAGLPNKGIKVTFGTTTISDEVKVQQGLEYKIRNLTSLYNQGIIGQEKFAWEMGYDKPDQKEPRIKPEESNQVSSPGDNAKKQKREADKDTSDRKTRDKNNPNPKRADQDTRKR